MTWQTFKNWLRQQPKDKQSQLFLTLLRLCIASGLLLSLFLLDQTKWVSTDNQVVLLKIAFAYLLFSALVLVSSSLSAWQWPLKIPLQISIDIGFILLLIHASGGSQSGFGFVLIVVLVTASLMSEGKYALFYASIATIGLLLEHTLRILLFEYPLTTFSQPVLLSLACFATAWLAHDLGKRMQQSQALVSQQQLDLDHLAQINTLISRESQDGIIVIDHTQHIQHCNAAAMRLLSTKTSFAGQHLSLIPSIYPLYARWQADPDSPLIVDVHTYSLKIQFFPMQTSQQTQPVGAIIFIQDFSQQKTQSQQAKLAALGTLTAKIAHEIRNPLSSISHANQLLQEDIVASDQVRMLSIVEDNIARIDQIIKDVLELNRRDRTQAKTFSLSQFVQEFHHQFCAVENINSTDFVLTVPNTLLLIQFDHRHLTQILWNLCKNGWEHSQKQQKSLQLTLQSDVIDLVTLTVKDDGEGIAKTHQTHLFEPFFTTKASGSGLGLYISRELAEANGALLTYAPRDQGSAFILEIKLKPN